MIRPPIWFDPSAIPSEGAEIINLQSPQASSLRYVWPLTNDGMLQVDPINGEPLLAVDGGASFKFSRRTVGSVGRLLYYPGDEARLVSTHPISLPQFTISVWCIPDFTNGTSLQAFAKLVSSPTTFASDPFIYYSMGVDNSSPAKFTADISTGSSGSNQTALSTSTLVSGRLYHVAMTYDQVGLKLYINGVLETTTATTLAIAASVNPLVVGAYRNDATTGNNRWKGHLFDLRMYGRALGADAIAQLYAPETRFDLYAPHSLGNPFLFDNTRRGFVSFAEMEIPTAPRQGFISFAEMEVPTVDRRGTVSFAEMEVPTAARAGTVSFAEMQIPPVPRRGLVFFAEMEVTNATGVLLATSNRHRRALAVPEWQQELLGNSRRHRNSMAQLITAPPVGRQPQTSIIVG